MNWFNIYLNFPDINKWVIIVGRVSPMVNHVNIIWQIAVYNFDYHNKSLLIWHYELEVYETALWIGWFGTAVFKSEVCDDPVKG